MATVLERFPLTGNSVAVEVCEREGDTKKELFLRIVRLLPDFDEGDAIEIALTEGDEMFDVLMGALAYARTLGSELTTLAELAKRHPQGVPDNRHDESQLPPPHKKRSPRGACSVEGCANPVFKMGLCMKHQRLSEYVDEIPPAMEPQSDADTGFSTRVRTILGREPIGAACGLCGALPGKPHVKDAHERVAAFVFRDPAEKDTETWRVRIAGRITRPTFNSKGAAAAYLDGIRAGRAPEW